VGGPNTVFRGDANPACPAAGASSAGSGDCALACAVSITMLLASIKDVISILDISVAPSIEQPGARSKSRAFTPII
jgi:hypothetical protein